MNTKLSKIFAQLFMLVLIQSFVLAYADSKKQQKASQIPQMNKLIVNIHNDLKLLSKKYDWLSAYNNKCLLEGRSIFFMHKQKDNRGTIPQQPDQIYIGYGPISAKKGFKYSNDVEKESVCRFPSLGSKIYANILIRGKSNFDLVKKIKQIILKRCKEVNKAINKK